MPDELVAILMLLDVKMNATSEEKQQLYDDLQASGEDCTNCEHKDDCPIYDALMN